MTASHTPDSKSRQYDRWDALVERYGRWVIRWRWAVLIATVALALLAAAGGQHLGFSTSYRVFFSAENPQLAALDALQAKFTKDDGFLLVLKPKSGPLFTPERLAAIRSLSEEAWKVPFATRVDSIANFQHSSADGDDLLVRDLVPVDEEISAAQALAVRDIALKEPLLKQRLISADGHTTGINIVLTLPEKALDEVPTAMAYVRQMVDEFRAKNPDIHVAITGMTALNNAFTEASMQDMSTLVPLMYGVLVLVMVVLFRSFSSTFATVLVIGLSVTTAMGLAGWLGILLTPPSVTAPTIILTIAIADGVHLLITMLREMRLGMDKRAAIVESLRVKFQPIFLTSLTTVIGFLSLNFSDAPPFRDLGNITAMGVCAAWFYSILFLPALLAILPIRAKVAKAHQVTVMERFADKVIANRRLLLWGMTAVVVAFALIIPRIQLNDQFVNYFDDSISFRADTDFAVDNLSGIYQLEYSLPSAGTGGINDPAYLRTAEAFSNWLEAEPGVVHVRAITQIVKRLNKNMHGDDESFYRLPSLRDLAAQYLLLFELSLPYGLDLNNQIDVDKSSTRLIATLENITTVEARALERRAIDWLAQNGGSMAQAQATGPFLMFAYISERNIQGMLLGTAIAFLLISLTLVLALRSFRLGAISLVPNLVPAIMAFGIWSIFVGEINMASSVVAATALGIIVDATVHFLSKYRRARLQRGADAPEAVRYAFSTVGTALWVTSLILIVGFAVLSLSAFGLNQVLGQLTAITLAAALVADFLLLPAILLTVDKPQAHIKELNDDARHAKIAAE